MLRVEIWNIILILAKRQIDEHILLSLFSQLSISFLPWKLNRKPASVLRKTQIETLFCHKTQDCIFVEANPWNWSREQKHCTISVMPRFHIPNFATRTIFRERCGRGTRLCKKKCLPSPSAFGFVWFLSPCPLEEVFVREVAISLSFTVYGAISLFPRKQSSPDLQHPPWQYTREWKSDP